MLRQMFSRAPGGLGRAQREFIEAFKRATFGAEEKQLANRLDGFLDQHHEAFLAAPSAELWGNPAQIWPEGCEWLVPEIRKLAEAVSSLRGQLASRDLSEKQMARFDAFFTALPQWTAGAPLPRAIEYLLENTLAVWRDVRRGTAEITVERKKVALGPAECTDLANIVTHLVGAELVRRLEITRGIHAVLRGYEAVYHEAVRRNGRLSFGDVQRLLLPQPDGPLLVSGEEDGGGRLAIDFRLDGQFDHWLLDEFQDTSFGQWSVLRNLIDEAVQDPTGARSFFCVGDVKQAIYTWREGDPTLFREILDHYNQAEPGTIAEEHLVASWRSGPAIIEMVNSVFGRGDVLAGLFPGAASENWNREWRSHESARPTLNGHAAWLHGEDEAERFALTVRLLHEIDPLARGLECAVLTQSNATATALADYLRREGGIPAIAESDLHVATDNPLGAALLALVQAAAHPGDRFAQEHLAMTPLRAVLDAENLRTAEAVTQRVLAQIHADGFERTMAFWLKRIEPRLAPDDIFSRERARQFVAAAALFDATGGRTVAEFVAFMERHVVRDAEVAGVVKVMTIHKAKGLGFDVVLLPDLEGDRIDQRRDGLAVQRADDRAVEWVLDLPTRLFYSQDETLAQHVRAAEMEACHEALALLYVAMTRAKRAMYLITKTPGASVSRNYRKLLGETLGERARLLTVGKFACSGSWEAGDSHWHEAVDNRGEKNGGGEKTTVPGATAPGFLPAPRRTARRPSAGRTGRVSAVQTLALDGAAAAEFGNQVHALLAEVESRATADLTAWARRGLPDAVVSEAQACVSAAQLAEVWNRETGVEVWRERAFEIVLDGAWIAGAFDRVLVGRDRDGRATWARIFDFKTERVPNPSRVGDAVRRHSGQLNLYRRVAAVLTGLPPSEIACELIFTHEGLRVNVPPS